MKRIFISLALIGLSTGIFAGTNESTEAKSTTSSNATEILSTKTLVGKIMDHKTAESLAGATILYNGKKIYSDFDGNFRIQNFSGSKGSIVVSMISYKNQNLTIDLSKSNLLNVKMIQL